MVPMCSSETVSHSLSQAERQTLLKLAHKAILHGLQQGSPLKLDQTDYPESLQVTRATFVTLQRKGRLRGCIGHLEAIQPLVKDVSDNAFAAAFRDPRFPPLSAAELADLELHISVLTPSSPMTFTSEEDLLSQLQPGVDGLIMEDGLYRGTFLPSVWEQLPDPVDFLRHLKQKAGLSQNHWSDSLTVSRYRTESFP
ncbi:MAG: AmmeMemoRadiSam system protein A [Candidatus Sedimenticola sp. (ex Thyasira tokunagai)]